MQIVSQNVLSSPIKAIFFLLLLISTSACRKDHPTCYDEKLYQERKGSFCPTDCPGVTGCDGKFYCNECEANRNGIRVK